MIIIEIQTNFYNIFFSRNVTIFNSNQIKMFYPDFDYFDLLNDKEEISSDNHLEMKLDPIIVKKVIIQRIMKKYIIIQLIMKKKILNLLI